MGEIGPNSSWFDSTTRHVRLCRASRDERVERDECVELCFSNMADDEEAVVLASAPAPVGRPGGGGPPG